MTIFLLKMLKALFSIKKLEYSNRENKTTSKIFCLGKKTEICIFNKHKHYIQFYMFQSGFL
jgi:hypothetical protein